MLFVMTDLDHQNQNPCSCKNSEGPFALGFGGLGVSRFEIANVRGKTWFS